MSKPVFVGLDLETTAGNQYGRICQIGVAFNLLNVYVEDVCPGDLDNALVCDRWPFATPPPENEFVVEAAALKVNGFDDARLAAGADRGAVDEGLSVWLAEHVEKPGSLVPVGFNVAGFDMPFVRRELPLTAQWFGYRSVDLNAICFALGAHSQKYDDKAAGWEYFKKRAKRHTAKLMGQTQWHDAGFDAMAAMLMFDHLTGEMG